MKDKNNIVSTVDFLVKKIEKNNAEFSRSTTVSKHKEIAKHQDRLVDFLMEETEKVSQTKDLEQIENALSKLEFLRREATSEG